MPALWLHSLAGLLPPSTCGTRDPMVSHPGPMYVRRTYSNDDGSGVVDLFRSSRALRDAVLAARTLNQDFMVRPEGFPLKQRGGIVHCGGVR